MAHSYLEDINGNKSSKRLLGFIIIIFTLIISAIFIIVCICSNVTNTSDVLSLIKALLTSGVSLLGVGSIETFSKK